jgi:hypothetical protein
MVKAHYSLSRLRFKVLFTKLRSSNASEHEQYLKAAKALLVLIPLLGTTHIIVLKGPTIGMPGLVFSYIRTILLSTQVNHCHESLARRLRLGRRDGYSALCPRERLGGVHFVYWLYTLPVTSLDR